MSFKKWHSIENTYRQKHIAWFLDTHPGLANETFVITEKLHGSNFQWYFSPGEPLRAGSRNNFLDINGSFQGASILQLISDNQDICMKMVREFPNRNIRLFGELVGPGIQKGVRYGDTKRILYFGFYIDDGESERLQPFTELERLIDANFLVPVVAKVQGLKNALEFDTNFDSLVLGEPDNQCEGIIIQPYETVYYDRYGNSPFLMKKKNEAFKEKERVIRVVNSEVNRLNLEFRSYMTENRLQSIFSKHDEIEHPSQMGDYIRWILDDAKEDFLKDFSEDFSALEKKDQKQVFNVGGTIANMLKAYL